MCSVAPEYYRRLQARGPPRRRASARDPELEAAELAARDLARAALQAEYAESAGKLSVMRAATDAAREMMARVSAKRDAMERRLLVAATRASVSGEFRETERLSRIIKRLDGELAQLAEGVNNENRKFIELAHARNAEVAAARLGALGAWCP